MSNGTSVPLFFPPFLDQGQKMWPVQNFPDVLFAAKAACWYHIRASPVGRACTRAGCGDELPPTDAIYLLQDKLDR
jgi:hypothetical protein